MTTVTRPPSLRRNALANVAGRTASALTWLLMTPFVLTHLGTERFAVWSLFFALGGYVANLDFGMTHGVSRYVAVGASRGDRRLVGSVLGRSLVVGTALGVVWCLAFLVMRHPFQSWFKIPATFSAEALAGLSVFALSMLVFSVTQVLHGALIGFQRLEVSNGFMLAGLLAHVATLLVGLPRGGGLVAAGIAMTVGHATSGLLAAAAVRRELRRVPESASGGTVTWGELARFGGLVQATGVFATGWQQAGKVVLGTLGSLAWVTTFELGYRVALAVLSLPQLIVGAVIPAAARASASGGDAEVRGVYDWASRWIFALAGPMLAGLWLVAPSLVTLWIGPGHGDSVAVARTAAIMFGCLILVGPATGVARGAGAPGLETTAFAIAFGLDVALSILLVPRFGPLGAVWAMLISIVIAGAWIVARIHARLGVPTVRWLRGIGVRMAGPGVVAAVLAGLGLAPLPAARGEALRDLLIAGASFAALAVAVTWRSGDARAVLGVIRARRSPASIAGVRGGGEA